MTFLVAVVAALTGYAAGRRDLGQRLLSWAEDAASPGWKTWRFWPAAPIILIALAWIWTVHPRRTLANVRSCRQEPPPRGPAVTFSAREEQP